MFKYIILALAVIASAAAAPGYLGAGHGALIGHSAPAISYGHALAAPAISVAHAPAIAHSAPIGLGYRSHISYAAPAIAHASYAAPALGLGYGHAAPAIGLGYGHAAPAIGLGYGHGAALAHGW